MEEIRIAVVTIILMIASSILYFASRVAKVDYVGIPCPTCGSCEVLDFGTKDGKQKGHCYDCKQEFYISETGF